MTKYIVVLINTDTGSRACAPAYWTSKKKAVEWAEAWKKAQPGSNTEIYKNDLHNRIY